MCHEILRRIFSMNVSFVLKCAFWRIRKFKENHPCWCTVAPLRCWRQAEPEHTECCKLTFGFCTNLNWSLNNQKFDDYCCNFLAETMKSVWSFLKSSAMPVGLCQLLLTEDLGQNIPVYPPEIKIITGKWRHMQNTQLGKGMCLMKSCALLWDCKTLGACVECVY